MSQQNLNLDLGPNATFVQGLNAEIIEQAKRIRGPSYVFPDPDPGFIAKLRVGNNWHPLYDRDEYEVATHYVSMVADPVTFPTEVKRLQSVVEQSNVQIAYSSVYITLIIAGLLLLIWLFWLGASAIWDKEKPPHWIWITSLVFLGIAGINAAYAEIVAKPDGKAFWLDFATSLNAELGSANNISTVLAGYKQDRKDRQQMKNNLEVADRMRSRNNSSFGGNMAAGFAGGVASDVLRNAMTGLVPTN